MRNEQSIAATPAARRPIVFAPLRGLVQIGSFIGKELSELRRQPQLVISLIAGPFVLLLLFGVGYSPEPPRVRTLVVIPDDSPYRSQIEQRKEAFGAPFVLEGITGDAAEAQRRLEAREIEAVITFPKDPFDNVAKGQYSPLLLEFNEIDPTRAQWISYYGYVQTNELNKRLLVEALKQNQGSSGQEPSAATRQTAATLRDELNALNPAAQSGDRGAIDQQAVAMQGNNAKLQQQLLTVAQLFGAVAVISGTENPQNSPQSRDLLAAQEASTRLGDSLQQLRTRVAAGQFGDPERQLIGTIGQDVTTLNDTTGRLTLPPAEVVVSPFEPKSRDIAQLEPNFVTFYAPGVIALLAQHIAVTLTALTLVRERLLGTVEILRVAPIGVWTITWGKYVSHFCLTALLAAGLTAAMHFGLGVPILGGYLGYALLLGLLIAASLSVGFFISAIANSESQAVQFSLLLLIGSVLFGGFFISLQSLTNYVRPVSYVLPLTYGVLGLQSTMLRGEFPPLWVPGVLAGMALGLFLISSFLFRRQMKRR